MARYGVVFTNCDNERQVTLFLNVEDYDMETYIGIRCFLDLTIKKDGTIQFELKKKKSNALSSFLHKITFRKELPTLAYGPCSTKYGSFIHLPHMNIEIKQF